MIKFDHSFGLQNLLSHPFLGRIHQALKAPALLLALKQDLHLEHLRVKLDRGILRWLLLQSAFGLAILL